MTRNPKKLILVLSANCHAVLKLFAYPSGRPFGRIINIIFPTFFLQILIFIPSIMFVVGQIVLKRPLCLVSYYVIF